LSVRRGYWFLTADGVFDGPFKSIKETKEAASKIPPSVEVSIRAMVSLEKRDANGQWATVH
jgi:hypothetical protein